MKGRDVNKPRGRRVLLFIVLLSSLILSGCIEIDWQLNMEPDGSGTAVIKFTNESLPTFNFKADLERGSQWIAKLYEMGATSETGKEGGRDYVLYRVAFSDLSQLSDEDLGFSFTRNNGTCEFRATPTAKARRQAWGAMPIPFRLSVAMPGRVIDSSAGQVSGNVVSWNTTLTELLSGRVPIYARSKTPRFVFPRMNVGLREWVMMLGIALFLVVGAIATHKLVRSRRRMMSSSPAERGVRRFARIVEAPSAWRRTFARNVESHCPGIAKNENRFANG